MSELTHTRVTTIGGTLVILLANINSSDIIRTVVLTMIGAIVSFLMSLLIKKVMKWWKSPRI
jgi:urea transporter